MQREVDRIAAERILATPPRQRAAREQEELRAWALEKMPRGLLEMTNHANDTAVEVRDVKRVALRRFRANFGGRGGRIFCIARLH